MILTLVDSRITATHRTSVTNGTAIGKVLAPRQGAVNAGRQDALCPAAYTAQCLQFRGYKARSRTASSWKQPKVLILPNDGVNQTARNPAQRNADRNYCHCLPCRAPRATEDSGSAAHKRQTLPRQGLCCSEGLISALLASTTSDCHKSHKSSTQQR